MKTKVEMTYKDVCEIIERANFLRGIDDKLLTANQIFNYSSTGELYMIHEWYETACKILNIKMEENE